MEKKGANSAELQKPNVEAEVYNNNKKCGWDRKKKRKQKLKSLIIFKVPIKSTTTTVGGWEEKKKEKNPKESTEQVKT